MLVRELFEELGVLRDGKWDERALCFAPQERLYIHGRWQEGIEPDADVPKRDREQFRRFYSLMAEFRASGRFTIPIALGGDRAEDLSNVSMESWMDRNRLRFAVSALVHQLRLPRRLWRFHARRLGLGWHSLFRLARARR